MSATIDVDETAPPKFGKMPLIIGILLAIGGGVSGYFAVEMGFLAGLTSDSQSNGSNATEASQTGEANTAADDHGSAQDNNAGVVSNSYAFVPIDPLIISLPRNSGRTHLKFAAQLEVSPADVTAIESVRPRITDVLNTYLRAIDIADFEDPSALHRLRSQMLRRIQIVVGDGAVRDLLIMEFVVN